MFNSTTQYNRQIVSTHVNAVTGNITKTYRKSFFKQFHLQSTFAGKILDDNPTYHKNYNVGYVPVVVIQMVICGDMEVMAEIMFKEDYDNLFKEEN